MKVRDIMTSHVSASNANASIDEIARKMKELNVGSIPICDNQNHVIGIVTDRDIVVRGIVDGFRVSDNIEKVMSKELIFVSPDTHTHEAARIMAQNQIRRLPVVENGKLVGLVAIGDLAVRNIYVDDAGKALSDISLPSRPMM
ncbi:CBS domain-containing protein [Clostridium formicaceticum]|uniref:CBS domain-containing protein n=1 Tax=Clostridium formicaceticum TaxID=1497 RepID=A0AAC9WGH0_9CLOT|nr:CBS domain-containing protein [Clostridium formicaceticum]AOY76326.1 CBS domain-containing protein [Clostridium formicaceticum]ARE86715.1 Hypoxic response protein 1 [Clostridium formicaceticum]